MDESEMIVTAKEAAELGFCVSGARTIARKHGVDFRKYLNDGISVAELREINDPLTHRLADKVVKLRGEG